MEWLKHRKGELFAEDVSIQHIADQFGTPCFVYSKHASVQAFREFKDAAKGRNVLVCYSLKANSNLAVIDLLRAEGAGVGRVSERARCS